jgi:hypothetical protein
LWPFGIFYGNFVILWLFDISPPPFGIFYQEKSGNPETHPFKYFVHFVNPNKKIEEKGAASLKALSEKVAYAEKPFCSIEGVWIEG